jgi:hypothetical protein
MLSVSIPIVTAESPSGSPGRWEPEKLFLASIGDQAEDAHRDQGGVDEGREHRRRDGSYLDESAFDVVQPILCDVRADGE